MRFVDSNIWLYALGSTGDLKKQAAAASVINFPDLVISTQVINEVCFNLIRKSGFDALQVQEVIESMYERALVVQPDKDSILLAVGLRESASLSYWDSQLVACAVLVGCAEFLSEDMHDGQLIEGSLRVRNPFKH